MLKHTNHSRGGVPEPKLWALRCDGAIGRGVLLPISGLMLAASEPFFLLEAAALLRDVGRVHSLLEHV